MANIMLTTVDNPWNPFVHFDEWNAWDENQARKEQRPSILRYLAKIAEVSSYMSDRDYDQAVEDAINEAVAFNVTGKYRRISEEDAKTLM